MAELRNLFQPIKIGDMELKNRIVMAPMGTGFGNTDGSVSEQLINYYAERAKGGAGLITIEATSVDALSGKIGPWQLAIDNDRYIPGFAKLTHAIHAGGARASLQLNHGGRYARSSVTGTQPVAPSPIASRYTGETPRELTTGEIEAIIEKFGDAARRAREAGFDAVELMANTGYLISQFLSPITNKRTDRFGGDTLGRATFLIEIIKNIRGKLGKTFPISVKHSVDEYMPGGTTIEDSKIIVKAVEEAGASIIHAWAGWHESPIPMLPMSVKRGAFVPLAEAMKEVVNIPVIAVGRINDPRLADQIIGEGRADLVAAGRAFIADPYFAQKAAEGKFEDIRMCIACCRCFDCIMKEKPPIVCTVNPELGREGEGGLKPASVAKRVLIIGGGPAGMEAAIVATLRGHKVMLWEEKGKLGGNLILASVAPYKEEINTFTHYLINQVRKLKIKVELNKKTTAEEVVQLNPDEVIIAAGAVPIIPHIPGVNRSNVVTAIDVLSGKVTVGDRAVVAGGGMIGCEVAEFLASKGKKTTIIEMLDKIAKDIGPTTAWTVRKRIKDAGIQVLTSAKVIAIDDNGVTIDKPDGLQTVAADTVVLAVGLQPDTRPVEMLKTKIDRSRLHVIGDCAQVSKILEAIHGGWRVGCEI